MSFPNGLKRTLALFSKATYDILNSDEYEKVKKHSSRKERKYIDMLKKATEGESAENFVLWAMMTYLQKCPNLVMDILTDMVLLDDACFTEKELAEFFKQ